MGYCYDIKAAGVSGTDRDVKVTWKCSAAHVDHYTVYCWYHTSKNGWTTAEERDVKYKEFVWTVPRNYTIDSIYFNVIATSAKTRSVTTGSGSGKGTTLTTWWTDTWSNISSAVMPSNVKRDNDANNVKLQAGKTASSHWNSAVSYVGKGNKAKTAEKRIGYWKKAAAEYREAAKYYTKAGRPSDASEATKEAKECDSACKSASSNYVTACNGAAKTYKFTASKQVAEAKNCRTNYIYKGAADDEKAAAANYRKASAEYQDIIDFDYATENQKSTARTNKSDVDSKASACDSRASKDAEDRVSYTTTVPAAPTGLSVTVGSGGKCSLSFSCPAAWAAYVQVRVSVDGGSWSDFNGSYVSKKIGTTGSMTATYQGAAGHTYRFAVRSVLASKKVYSDWVYSNTLHAKPSNPTDLELSVMSATAVKATWRNAGKAGTALQVQWSTYYGTDNAWIDGATSEIRKSADLPPSTSQYTITGLTPGEKLYVRVLAKSPNGEAWAYVKGSSKYVTASATPPVARNSLGALSGLYAAEQPGYPQNAVLRWSGKLEVGASLHVDYSANEAALEYNVQGDISTVDVDSSGWPEGSAATERVFTVTGLEPGSKYWFRVRKVHPGSAELASASVAATSRADAGKAYCWHVTPPKGSQQVDAPTGLTASLKQYAGAFELDWSAAAGNASYEIQYTDNLYAFDDNAAGDIETVTYDDFGASDVNFKYTLTDLDGGRMWLARVRAQGEDGHSDWATVSESQGEGAVVVSQTVVGVELPADAVTTEAIDPPTPTATEPAYSTGDTAVLSWTHNSAENAAQTGYQVAIRLSGADGGYYEQVYEGGSENAMELVLEDVPCRDGDSVEWGVRTAGVVVGAWSEWSAFQRFEVVAPPSAGASLADGSGAEVGGDSPLTVLPLSVTVTATVGVGDSPVQYAAEVVATTSHRTVLDDGTESYVAAGDAVWSAVVAEGDDGFGPGGASFSVGGRDAQLDNGESYEVVVRAYTAYGMVAESEPVAFAVEWGAEMPAPSGVGVFDYGDFTCRIFPTCYLPVEDGEEEAEEEEAEETEDEGGEYYPDDPTEDEPYYTAPYDEDEEFVQLRPDTELDVYRVDFDGGTVLIAEGLPNNGRCACTDPHPNFGTVRYRIVAHDMLADVQSAMEITVEADVKSVVVTWDEDWASGDEGDFQEYYGSRAVLPHGLSLEESPAPTSRVNLYAGNRYGTLYMGSSGTYDCSYGMALLELGDNDTVAALRSLAQHRGACYVRDPSGLGFWAQVLVRFSHTLSFRKRSASLEVHRVEPPRGRS